ncbi:hypothetical protein MMC16_004244 [Acarospora aff. strigata]|nr:hypothetical protein [Acarospora aff. strigata]
MTYHICLALGTVEFRCTEKLSPILEHQARSGGAKQPSSELIQSTFKTSKSRTSSHTAPKGVRRMPHLLPGLNAHSPIQQSPQIIPETFYRTQTIRLLRTDIVHQSEHKQIKPKTLPTQNTPFALSTSSQNHRPPKKLPNKELGLDLDLEAKRGDERASRRLRLIVALERRTG